MNNLYTVLPGMPLAELAVRHILTVVPANQQSQAVIFVPTRRAAVTLRGAFQRELAGRTALLPRIIPLAEIEQAILTLLGSEAIAILESIPPAMPDWQQRYLLAAQVSAFLKRRDEVVMLDYVLALTDALMRLQEQCARAGVCLTRDGLQQLVHADMAAHWEEALDFLSILAQHWPVIERECGMTIAATREVALLSALASTWQQQPTELPVFVVGSTASQEATANLLVAIAALPNGGVILPGVDATMPQEEWEGIVAGHPLYHLKALLDRLGVAPAALETLGVVPDGTRNLWYDALAVTESIPAWRAQPLADYQRVRLIPCAQPESEARVISLLLREALETPKKRTALITPDEGLMARVAAHMERYGVTVDRMAQGTLATTDYGSLWVLLLAALSEPERLIHLKTLLHHPLMATDTYFLTAMEPYWYGVVARRPGQLPKLPEALLAHEACHAMESLVRDLHRLSRAQLSASGWLDSCMGLLAPWCQHEAPSQEVVQTALAAVAGADLLGALALPEFVELVRERLSQPVRHGGVASHPQLFMLTPVEARLERFDRVILAAMTDQQWPGGSPPNAWLNLAAQAALGLPPPEHQVSLMAHDMLMQASSAEVFCTWPLRDQGSPTTRSRFLERLVTLLAAQGIKESQITASQYEQWAQKLYASDHFQPSDKLLPRPSQNERPRRLPVNALDTLFSDPFSIYAKYVLKLNEVNLMDAEAQASDFGSLAHKAIHALTLHWNTQARSAEEAELEAIADRALRDFSDRPGVALFWRTRLLRALAFVDGIEVSRRSNALAVTPELPVETALSLGEAGELILYGRIDRLEEGTHCRIADYKTGAPPSLKEIRDGHATQLLAYAMLLEAQGKSTDTVEYWRLPHGRHEGEISELAMEELLAQELPQRLQAALTTMLEPNTPFLASPDRYGHAYDGLSRYDEWAE